MTLNIIRAILIVALIGTFSTIFGFSNQNSKTSGGISQKVTEYIVKFIPNIQQLEEVQKIEWINENEAKNIITYKEDIKILDEALNFIKTKKLDIY